MQSNDTGKFWSFKDTKTHKNVTYITSANVVRTFLFNRSFLIRIKQGKETKYVIPYKYTSVQWPNGFYTGISDDLLVMFIDDEIKDVVN
jgi:hypothetical protein